MFDRTELEEMTAKAAGVDEHLLTDDDLLAEVESLTASRRRIDAAVVSRLAELDARGTTDIAHGMRTASWLARTSGCAPAGARSRVNLARSLRSDLPATDRAIREGRLCTDRAKVMAGAVNDRIVAQFQAMEESLIAESASMTFDVWAQRVRLVAALLDEDGPEPADDIAANRLSMTGSVEELKISATIVGPHAVTTRQALEQLTDEWWRRFRDDSEQTSGEVSVPSMATLRALAFVEVCRRGLMVNPDGNGTAPKVEATLVINADDPGLVFVDGVPLRRGSSAALACDMSVWTIIVDSLGVPLDMGREIRAANRVDRVPWSGGVSGPPVGRSPA